MKRKVIAAIAAFTLSSGCGVSVAAAAVAPSPGASSVAAAVAVGAPGAPGAPTGTNVTQTSITLNWLSPTNTGDTPITRYAVRTSLNGGPWLTPYAYTPVANPAATTLTRTGLTSGASYRFQVIAQNSAGYGTYSLPSQAVFTMSTTAPSAPLNVTGTKGNAKVSLTWQAPSDLGGSPITGYGVDYTSDGTTWITAVRTDELMTARSYTVLGLTNGTPYTFRVVAANAIGAGLSATSLPYTPAVAAPAAPTGLIGTNAARTSITLHWLAPADNGAPVTRYGLRLSLNGGPWVTPYKYTPVSNPGATTLTWTGLTPDSSYRFQVTGQNSVGYGAWSAPSAAVRTTAVDVTAPGPVTGLTVFPDSSTETSVSLHWTNPTDADFTGVMIRREIGATAPTLTTGTLVRDLIDNDPTDPYMVDISGVTAGTQYTYSFFAHDEANNYAPAAHVTFTTDGGLGVTPPEPITALTGTLVSATSIKLDWTNPTDLHFTGVTVRRAEGATAPVSASTGDPVTVPASETATSFTDTGLTVGTVYSYAVFAHDAVGNLAAGVNVTVTVTVAPTAVLLVTSDGEFFDFDASGSIAAGVKTLSTGTLDYGDGSALEMLSDEFGWSGSHMYDAAGEKTVTLTVTDSAGVSATTVKTVTVAVIPGAPTAEITIAGNPTGSVQVGSPVAFTLASTTVTAITSWTVAEEAFGTYGADNGTPPATVTHTFNAPGQYTVTFDFNNEAGQTGRSSMVVTVVPVI